ncbi:ArsA family ATPase [Prochlorothrix hollandica]|uniref:Arsenic transporter n=1 Tax=Prochlorothrix hollandica PCC 9006 = CALU 1027 TaxID=317619 RepID=A0A0M2Q350_PROHO|nr:ArsA family ATPase [Prochlorothrix hollandica]KKJ01027.1 arsenic transporter [Prochlorothrix hollandica PCC 9006 = CALU 1027]
MTPYDHLQLVLLSGKGGVGKTTLSCALARTWAHQFPQERILIISTDPAHSLGDVLLTPVTNTPQPLGDLPNLQTRALDAKSLLQDFKDRYGDTLELLLERGSFVDSDDLGPVWDLNWPGIDELMGILEIQRLLRESEADRVVVDMAPSGHSLNLLGLMDFLDQFLAALELFQDKHHAIQQAFGRGQTPAPDQADDFLQTLKGDLLAGRQLLQDVDRTACLVVAIPEPMSFLETERFMGSLADLQIHCGGILLNRVILPDPNADPVADPVANPVSVADGDRLREQHQLLGQFQTLVGDRPLRVAPRQAQEPVGGIALDALFSQLQPPPVLDLPPDRSPITWPDPTEPQFPDFLAEGRKLILLGGKGGVGKTTVAAALGWGLAQRYPDRSVRVISIDPAHSLGDAFGRTLGHQAQNLEPNLSAQEVDAEEVLDQFRQDYLWELAEMMSGDSSEADGNMKIAYGPEAWRKLADQSLPGIDEMLSLITVMELLEQGNQDLIVLDTAPTGHLLRFLEMPTALAEWLGWIFKLWIKYQNVVGRSEFMGRLRGLRKQVVMAQKKLQDPQHTEFIAVCQNQSAIVAETRRLVAEMDQRQIHQRFVVHNRYEPALPLAADTFGPLTVVPLANLPRSVEPLTRLQGAARLLLP